jgi:hypothetical protein
MRARILFKDAAGRELTTDDLEGVSGKVRWEVIGAGAIPTEASRLHAEAREAGGRGDDPRALNLLEQAHRLAPDGLWFANILTVRELPRRRADRRPNENVRLTMTVVPVANRRPASV